MSIALNSNAPSTRDLPSAGAVNPVSPAIATASPSTSANAAPVPAPAASSSQMGQPPAVNAGLPNDVWSQFSRIFGSARTAGAEVKADEKEDAETPAKTEADGEADSDAQKDAGLPAMALSLMPVILNFPMAPALTPAALALSPAIGGQPTDGTSGNTETAAVSGTAETAAAPDIRQSRTTTLIDFSGTQTMATQSGQTSFSSLPDTAGQAAQPQQPGNLHMPAEILPAADTKATAGAMRDLPSFGSDSSADRSQAGGATLPPSGNGADVWSATGLGNPAATPADTVKLAGSPTQWQQPLREALGDRLQMQLGKNSEQAVIRLDPPMLGRIEISIRHEAGALQVNMSATNNEVLRQLHSIGDSLRQDLSQGHRQYSDVAVTVSAPSRSNAGGNAGNGSADAEGRQQQAAREREENQPGRALADAEQEAGSFAALADKG